MFRDPFKWLLFELGAGYYARKLATGPEADLRGEFLKSMVLPAAQSHAHRNEGPFRVLDVGCGPAHVARTLAQHGCDVTGVDRSPRLLRIAGKLAARQKVHLRLERAPTDHLPFADATFDCSLATGVIYWVEHHEKTLREMMRVTRPGGTVVSLDPSASMSNSGMKKYSAEHSLSRRDARKLSRWATAASFNRRFTEAELRRLFQSAGLVNHEFEARLNHMVWFSRGQVPTPA
ncbi:MAG TPA: class I SAM-dependent methyltransferase [Candidatus Limnocylindria bacterium]|nr:class I SAM-dependent methyltransferase [Candidatus Limnocylindria bacterium]